MLNVNDVVEVMTSDGPMTCILISVELTKTLDPNSPMLKPSASIRATFVQTTGEVT
jgi:hypothetical protein